MSADPNSLPPQPEPVPPASGETPIETLPQKRRYKKPDASDDAPPSADPDAEIIVLSSLLQNLLARKGGKEGTGENTETETRGKINRFVSRKEAPAGSLASVPPEPPAAELPQAPAQVVAAGEPAPAAPSASPHRATSGGPEGMASIAFPKFEPRAFHPDPPNTWWNRSGSTWGRGVLYFAFTAAIALGAFLAGRNDKHTGDAGDKTASVGSTVVWLPPLVEQLDKALAAEQGGDLDAARKIVDGLQKTAKGDVTLDAYSAMLDTRLGRLNDVEASLSRRIGPGTPPEAAAVLGEAQAFNYCRRREFDRAADCFAEVAKYRPLDAKVFLRWGEALRRAGRASEAVAKFQESLLRLPPAAPGSADEGEYVAFKERVCLVELGRDVELKPELDKHLAAPAPTGYWLLTGAAVALQKGDIAAAVGLVKKAQIIFPPVQFTTLLEDYFFRGFAHHPEMAPFLSPPSPEQLQKRRLRMDYFVDP